ncbi:RHS domain-containing protein [Dentiradicibacter hellwigii]|uniref:RHS domain-containing protein n=1 Tax=Dentiradicibacter hellwigii TaxID=3149053 RepID=A0ABV4UED8_9RHOO
MPEEDALRALNYLYYGSGHLHQINFSRQDAGEESPRHQLIADIERDALHRETARSQGALRTRYALDPLGRRLGLWSQSADFSPEQPLAANDEGWLQALARAGQSIHARAGQSTHARAGQHPSPASHPLDGLLKAYIYDKAGELRRVRHSSQGDTLYAYDATGRITNKATSVNTISNEAFAYDPAGNLLDPSSQMALSRRTQHPQAGYVRDNLVRVFEDKRFSYDGFGRLIEKKIGRHTRQRFTWDEEDHLIAVTTTRRPGTKAQSEQTVRFTYDALGRRISKTDAFGTTFFIWEGMRLIEERRGQHVITYVYEPGSYVPLARLDATGLPRQNASPEPPVDKGLQGNLPGRIGSGLAGDAQSTRAAGQPKLCEVYYFHTDQVGLPEELTNAQGQRIWQASYKTWGNTVREAWAYAKIDGSPIFKI